MWRYVLAGILAALGITTAVMVFGAGIYWLWLFGDDQWPAWAEVALVGAAYTVGLAVLIGFGVVGYRRSRGG